MKKLALAALLGLFFGIIKDQKATAGCPYCAGGSRQNGTNPCLKSCLKLPPIGCPFQFCGACGHFGCKSYVPGPWYLYWPYEGIAQTAEWNSPWGWCYEYHFQTPAPTGYPNWPPMMNPGFTNWVGTSGGQKETDR